MAGSDDGAAGERRRANPHARKGSADGADGGAGDPQAAGRPLLRRGVSYGDNLLTAGANTRGSALRSTPGPVADDDARSRFRRNVTYAAGDNALTSGAASAG
ncbi:unnamed protein product, partial [marine sediment metagenome]